MVLIIYYAFPDFYIFVIRTVVTILILFSLYACTGKKDTNSIGGLLYLDGEPVSIEDMHEAT